MRNLEIYFNDLTPEAQERALAAAGVEDASDVNWDIFPITTLDFEEEEKASENLEFKFYISDDRTRFLTTEEGKVCEFTSRKTAERFYQECLEKGYLSTEDDLRVSTCVLMFMGEEEFENCDNFHAWEV